MKMHLHFEIEIDDSDAAKYDDPVEELILSRATVQVTNVVHGYDGAVVANGIDVIGGATVVIEAHGTL